MIKTSLERFELCTLDGIPFGESDIEESLIIISGSLLLESYFGIPGIGKVTYDAIVTGDQPVLKAVVALTAILFVVAQLLTDICYRIVDPRVSLT